MSDKTPASRQLLNITKALLDDANAEVERLRVEKDKLYFSLKNAKQTLIDVQAYGKRRETEIIEECARVADDHVATETARQIAAAIRSLKDKK